MKRRFLQRFLAVSLSVAVVGTSLPASAADFTDAAAGNTVTEDSFEDQHTDSSSETEEDSGQDSAQIVLTPEAEEEETPEQEESGTGENDQEENISSEDNSDEVEDLTDPSDSELTMEEEPEISPAEVSEEIGEESFDEGNVEDAGAVEKNFTYEVNLYNKDEVYITKYTGTAKEVEIPATLGGKTVSEISSNAFKDNTTLEKVTFSAEKLQISSRAFSGCTALKEVVIKKAVNYVDGEAFSGCTAFTTITVGKDTAFPVNSYWGEYVKTVQVEAGNTTQEVKDGVLFKKATKDNGKSLVYYPPAKDAQEYTVPTDVQGLERHSFLNVKNLKKLTINSKITGGWFYAIQNAPALEELVLGKDFSKKSDLSGLFDGNIALKVLNIQAVDPGFETFGFHVPEIRIGKDAGNLENTEIYNIGAEKYTLEDGNKSYQILNGALCNKSGLLIAYPVNSSATEFQVPDQVTDIGKNAFANAKYVTKVTMGEQVISIGESAFSGCKKLVYADISPKLRTIGSRAFDECSSLEEISTGNQVEFIGNSAFNGCSSLKNITIRSNAENTEIGTSILDGCSSLKEVMLDVAGTFNPEILGRREIIDTVVNLGSRIKVDTSDLTDYISIVGSYHVDEQNTVIKSVDDMILTKDGGKVLLYAGASDREELEIPDGVTEISRGAFWNAASLRKITLPSGLETVAEYAFAECSRLKNIEFPEGTKTIGANAFDNEVSLVYADIPKSVTSIGKRAFRNCKIRGYKGTAAETYAKENNLVFIDKETMDEDDSPVPGDFESSEWDGVKTEEVKPKGSVYTIQNAAQLAWVSKAVSEGTSFAGARIKLVADIDLAGYNWIPIGNIVNSFSGSFDGQNHTIYNLKTDTSLHQEFGFGLFGYVCYEQPEENVYIRNINIKDAELSHGNEQGILAGVINCYAGVNFTLSNCHTTGIISGGTLGGVVGRLACGRVGNDVTVKNCTSRADITTSGFGGGVIGSLEVSGRDYVDGDGDVTVEECKFSGVTRSTGRYGKASGIISVIKHGNKKGTVRVKRCVNDAGINGAQYTSIGGIVSGIEGGSGKAKEIIEQCVNKRYIHGGYDTGGICGAIPGSTTISQCYNTGTIGYAFLGGSMGGIIGSSGGIIQDCYNDGQILHTSAMDYNGGIAGHNNNIIKNCYSIGTLPDSGNSSVDVSYPGAIACFNNKEIRHCYYNLEEIPQQWLLAKVNCENEPRTVYTSPDNKRIESGGLTTAQMKTAGSYTDWDFQNVWDMDSEYAYGYPVLTAIKDLIDKHPDNEVHHNKHKKQEIKITVTGRKKKGDKKEPLLNGAKVSIGRETVTTNEAGVATIKMEENGTDILAVSKDGYTTYTNTEFKFPKNRECRVTLIPAGEVNEYSLGSVIMKYNTNEYELLSETKTISRTAKDTQFTIQAKPALANNKIDRYELVQGKKVIASSTDGLFKVKNGDFAETETTDKNGKVTYNDVVIQTCSDTKIESTTKINLKVEEDVDKTLSYTFGKGLKFTIGEDVPIFGGSSFSMSGFDLPVYFVTEAAENNESMKIKVGINLLKADLKDPKKSKALSAFASSTAESLSDPLGERKDFLKEFSKNVNKKKVVGMGSTSLDLKVYGYAEATVPYNNQLSGTLCVELSGGYSGEGQVVGTPIVYAIDFTGTITGTGNIVLNFDSSAKNSAKIGMKGELELSLYGGVGVAYLISGGFYGSGGLGVSGSIYPFETSGFENFYLKGSIGVQGRLLGAQVKFPILKGTYDIYKRDTSTIRSARSSGEVTDVQELLSDYDSYEAISRDSYDEQEFWDGNAVSTQASSGERTLVSNGYPEMAPAMFTCGSDTVMVFLNDAKGRDTADKSALYYSVYNAAKNTWSTPALVADNKTADFNPQVATDGTHAWVVWNDASSSLKGVDGITAISAKTEVAAAAYDSTTHSFKAQETLTSNNTYEIQPQITVVNSNPAITWTVNSKGDLWRAEGTNSIYVAQKSGSSWSTKNLVSVKESIQGDAVGTIGSTLYYAYSTGTLDQGSARKGYIVDVQSGSRTSLEGEQIENLRFGNIGGENALLWTDTAGTLYTRDKSSQTAVNAFENGGITGNVRQVIKGENGDAAILFTKNGENCANAYVIYYDGQNKKWSGITQLTDAADYVEQIQGAFVNGKLVLTYNKRKIDISKENDNGTNNLISKRIDHGKTELKAESVSFDTSKVKAGESLDLTVSVKNQGDKTCTGETVKILKGNTVVLETSADKTILSGETAEIPVKFTLPADLKRTEYRVQVTEKGSTANVSDSLKTSVVIGSANFRVQTKTYKNEDMYTMAATVFNNGYASGPVTAIFYDPLNPEKVYAQQTMANLAPDEVWNVSLDVLPEMADGNQIKKIAVRVKSSSEPEESYYDNTSEEAFYWESDELPKPTPTPSPKPTAKPTAAPKPTAKPTAAPKPTAKPTAAPKPTATPVPDGEKTVVTKDTFKNWPTTSADIEGNVGKIEDDILSGTTIYSLYFYGDAPEMAPNMFRGSAVTAYYPANNPTWTEDKLQSYGGSWTTWNPWDPETRTVYGANLKKYGELKLRYTTMPYTGAAQKMKIYVRDKAYLGDFGDQFLTENQDYKVTWKNNINVGTATVTVTGIAPYYRGTLTATFKIVQGSNRITASNVKKIQSTKKQTFSLGAKALDKAKLTYRSNNRSVTVDKNGKVTIAAKFAGAATITITASATKNRKTAKKNITVTVNPSGTSLTKCTNIKKRKADIRWKKNSYVTGYEIQYCTSKTFKSGVKKKVITKSSTTKYTAAGLASKKTYYVRIRTYKTVRGKKYYSSWSRLKAVKITK